MLGAYELVELIGSGGFGNVYRARHAKLGNEVAIKVLHAERCNDPANIARFVDEARTVNALKHSGIVEVFDFGVTADGTHYFVMELLRGRSLAAVLDQRGKLPFAEARPLLLALAEIVDAFHAKGASHRDLKPANIMIHDGRVTVIDFGLARLALDLDRTQTREVFGTPLYMAPEQCRGRGATAASDRYSFGALAYHVLTGAPPFAGEAIAVAVAHVETAPQRPSSRAGRDLRFADTALLALLAKDPSERPASLVAAVRAMRPPSRLARAAPLALGVLALGAAAGTYAMTHRATGPRRPIDPSKVRIVRTEVASLSGSVPSTMDHVQSLRPDGSAVDFATGAGSGAVTIPWTGPAEDSFRSFLQYRSSFPDGRRVESNLTTTLVDDNHSRTLGAGVFPEACADSRHVAMFSGNQLVVIDLKTDRSRMVADAGGAWGVRWSPSCDRMVWANSDGVHLTTIDGKTELLQLDIVGPARVYAPVAFLDQDTLAYCGRAQDGTTTLRARYLDHRSPDTILATLSPDLHGCSIAATPDGRRLTIATMEQSNTVVVHDLTGGGRHVVMRDSNGTARPLGFIDEDHVLVGTYLPQSSSLAEPPVERTRVHAATMELYGLDGTHEPATGCSGSIAMTRFRGQPVHIVLETPGGPYRLLSSACEEVATLSLDKSGPWSLPSCAGETCLGARLEAGLIVVEQLAPTRREIARAPHHDVQRDGATYPVVALSPDAKHGIALRNGDPLYLLVALDDQSVRTIRSGGRDPAVNQAVWANASTYYIGRWAGRMIDRLDLTGHRTEIGDRTVGMYQTSPSGSKLAATEIDEHRRILFVEIDR